MKIAICDDDIMIINQIKEYMKEIQDGTLEYDAFLSIEELKQYMAVKREEFDIYILDIEMGGMSGIDFAKEVRKEDTKALIIFMTSHSKYVFDVFETITFDFIEKPLTFEKMKKLFDRISGYLKINRKKFVFTYRKNNYSIDLIDINYLEKEGRKVWIYTGDEKRYQCNMTLEELWSQLDKRIFVGLNKSLIVNLSAIECIAGEYVILCGGKKLYVSRSYRKNLKEKHLEYLKEQI